MHMTTHPVRIVFIISLLLLSLAPLRGQDSKLTGLIIGTEATVDYTTFTESRTANTREMAFDGDLNTCFASWERSYTWCGLDLGTPHVITRVGWAPRVDSHGPQRVLLGVFEGANREDFMDALPLYIIDEQGTIGQLSYADVTCSRGFRYVRYVGPDDARCNIAELEFYGHAGSGDDTRLYQLTNLPTVSIHTLNGEIPYDKIHEIPAQVLIISGDGTHLLNQPATTRERGNYSRTFPKKPYRITFDRKQAMPGTSTKARKWNLINNYGDKTLLRNLLANHLSRLVHMPYTPYAQAVDVLLNGEYKGCYQLSDRVQVHEGRVPVQEMTPADTLGEALTGGYLIEVDAYAYEGTSWFYSDRVNPVTIHHPSDETITPRQFDYIRQCFNRMEQNPSSCLDYNTFLRHFLVGELSGNTDTYWSTYMYKYRNNDTLYTGPVWDFDIAFENDNRTYPINDKPDYIYRSGGSCAGNMRAFVDRIVIRDGAAQQQLLTIWDEVRHHGITADQLELWIDSLADQLDASQRLNFLRWPIMNAYVHQNPVLWGSYQGEVANVKRFLSDRIDWLDNRLGYTYIPYAPESVATVDASGPYLVYDLYGRPCGCFYEHPGSCFYEHPGSTSLHALPAGVYILRHGSSTQKILLTP